MPTAEQALQEVKLLLANIYKMVGVQLTGTGVAKLLDPKQYPSIQVTFPKISAELLTIHAAMFKRGDQGVNFLQEVYGPYYYELLSAQEQLQKQLNQAIPASPLPAAEQVIEGSNNVLPELVQVEVSPPVEKVLESGTETLSPPQFPSPSQPLQPPSVAEDELKHVSDLLAAMDGMMFSRGSTGNDFAKIMDPNRYPAIIEIKETHDKLFALEEKSWRDDEDVNNSIYKLYNKLKKIQESLQEGQKSLQEDRRKEVERRLPSLTFEQLSSENPGKIRKSKSTYGRAPREHKIDGKPYNIDLPYSIVRLKPKIPGGQERLFIVGEVLGEGGFGRVRKIIEIVDNLTSPINKQTPIIRTQEELERKIKAIEAIDAGKDPKDRQIRAKKSSKETNTSTQNQAWQKLVLDTTKEAEAAGGSAQESTKIDGGTKMEMDMSLVEGQEMFNYVANRTVPRPFEERIALFSQFVKAVQNYHDTGAAHRDLKPENIMMGYGFYLLSVDNSGTLPTTLPNLARGEFILVKQGEDIFIGCKEENDVVAYKKVGAEALKQFRGVKFPPLSTEEPKLYHITLKEVSQSAYGELKAQGYTLVPTVGLIDFGFSRKADASGHVDPVDASGTPDYVAPEVLSYHQTQATIDNLKLTDIYSVGQIMPLLFGITPPLFPIIELAGVGSIIIYAQDPNLRCQQYLKEGLDAYFKRQLNGALQNNEAFNELSSEAKTKLQEELGGKIVQLYLDLIKYNPKERISLEEAMKRINEIQDIYQKGIIPQTLGLSQIPSPLPPPPSPPQSALPTSQLPNLPPITPPSNVNQKAVVPEKPSMFKRFLQKIGLIAIAAPGTVAVVPSQPQAIPQTATPQAKSTSVSPPLSQTAKHVTSPGITATSKTNSKNVMPIVLTTVGMLAALSFPGKPIDIVPAIAPIPLVRTRSQQQKLTQESPSEENKTTIGSTL